MEFGIEYFDSALMPFDNFISRGTEHFLSCKSPDYLASVNEVRALSNSCPPPPPMPGDTAALLSHTHHVCVHLQASRLGKWLQFSANSSSRRRVAHVLDQRQGVWGWPGPR